MKIIEYTAAHEDTVQRLLNEGWQPYGLPMIRQSTEAVIQVMVKYEQSERPQPPQRPEPNPPHTIQVGL